MPLLLISLPSCPVSFSRLPLLPVYGTGALPYIAGSMMPLLGMTVPTILYLRSIEGKRRKEEAAAAAAAR